MDIRTFLAVTASKLTKKLLRLFGRGGTALPGKVALKLHPTLLAHLARDVRCIVITGTNGKTTSVRIIEEMLEKSGASYFSNRSGANLVSGITAEFIENSSLSGRPKKSFALIEVDEAASKEVNRLISPEIVLVTNIFRDQLDRYGEVAHTRENILIGLKNAPTATICLNADCSLSVSLADEVENKTIFYGVDLPIYKNPVSEISDATHCIRCKHEYKYNYRTFGHLGGFYCENCGYKRPKLQVAVTGILSTAVDSTTVCVNIFGDLLELKINLPGGYNIYNAAGALAVSELMGFDRESSKAAVASFSCGFGRMELFDLGTHSARMILVKNPAGCNQVLNYLTSLSEETLFIFCLNDKLADGTDVSWIWDVAFEKLVEMDERLSFIFVSGIRAYDMAVRLKYAGVPLEKLKIIEDYDALIKEMEERKLPVVIVPTYTAMMDLREKMSAVFGGKEFWK